MSRHSAPKPSSQGTTRRRRLLVGLGAGVGVVLFGVGAAFAYWTFTDSSNAHASQAVAGTVGAGQPPTPVSVSGRDVSLSWTAVSPATSYSVARTNVSPGGLSTTVSSSCSGSVSGTSCTDAGLPEYGTAATTWTYTETPFLDNWQGTASAPSAVVSVPGPTLSLGTSTFSTTGGTTSATVANFFDNEGVTYCVDQSSSCSAGNTLGTATVPASGGTVTTASIAVPAGLTVGTHTVYAIGSHSPGGSLPSATITVSGKATKLAFIQGPSAVVAGQTMTPAVTVQVEDNSGNPAPDAGVSITLATRPGVTVGGSSAVTNASGLATFNSIVINSAGTYTMTASATGLTRSPASGSFTVSKASTTTTASLSASTVTYGNEQTVTFTSIVSPQFSGTATGTVTLKAGATTLCTITLPGTTCTPSATALNASGSDYSVTATYNGDANFAGSTSSAQSLTISPDSATVSAFTVTGSPATYGAETGLVFHASVTAGHGEAIPNGDTVTVTRGATTICTMTLTSASGSCSPSSGTVLPAGTYTFTATFNSTGADPNFVTTATKTTNATISPDSATVSAFTVTGSPATYGAETSLVFHGSVTAGHGEAVPDGDTVTVTQGATTICTMTLTSASGSCNPSSGTVLAPGTYTFRATFNSTGADPNFVTTATKTVNATISPDSATVSTFTVTGSPANYGAETGLVFAASVTAGNGVAIPDGDTVTVTQGATTICTMTLTSASGSCSPSSGTVLPAGTYTNTITATFNSTGADPNFVTTATKSASATVNSIGQTITLTSTAPSNAAVNGTYTPTATATSGLAVTFTSATPTQCSVTAGAVKFLLAGTCTINADQAGNANFSAAPQVPQSVTVFTGVLVFTTPAVSGSSSSTPNLGPITIQRQDGAGTPITAGSVTVTGASAPSAGATFGGSQFGAPVTPSATLGAGTSSATFWYGQTATGPATITVTAPGYATGTQIETITAAPAGLGMVKASGSSGTPVISCGVVASSYTCNVTGVGNGGSVKFFAEFVDASGTPVVYSSTQASTITESGNNPGAATIAANASSSSPTALSASGTAAAPQLHPLSRSGPTR